MTDDITIKLYVHNLIVVTYIQYKFHEIPFIGYLVMAEDGKIIDGGTFICAHSWIFFKLCILITHYTRTMRMYLSNKIVKNKADVLHL